MAEMACIKEECVDIKRKYVRVDIKKEDIKKLTKEGNTQSCLVYSKCTIDNNNVSRFFF